MNTQPDLSARPHELLVERQMTTTADVLYRAWTENFDQWFAQPGTLSMKAEINSPFFFETHFDGQRHPHYGRFLNLVTDRLIEFTWVTGDPGTKGAETVVTVVLESQGDGALLTLRHAGLPDVQTKNEHEQAWPEALAHLDQKMTDNW